MSEPATATWWYADGFGRWHVLVLVAPASTVQRQHTAAKREATVVIRRLIGERDAIADLATITAEPQSMADFDQHILASILASDPVRERANWLRTHYSEV